MNLNQLHIISDLMADTTYILTVTSGAHDTYRPASLVDNLITSVRSMSTPVSSGAFRRSEPGEDRYAREELLAEGSRGADPALVCRRLAARPVVDGHRERHRHRRRGRRRPGRHRHAREPGHEHPCRARDQQRRLLRVRERAAGHLRAHGRAHGLRNGRSSPPSWSASTRRVARNVTLKVGAVERRRRGRPRSPSCCRRSTAELGNVVEEKVIKDVPLQGRNFTQLLLLSPASTPSRRRRARVPNGGDSTAINSFEGNSGIPGGYITNASIQGQQNRSKIYYVDGIVNTSVRVGHATSRCPTSTRCRSSRSSRRATRPSSAA